MKIYSNDPELYLATSRMQQQSVSVNSTQHMKKRNFSRQSQGKKTFIIGHSHIKKTTKQDKIEQNKIVSKKKKKSKEIRYILNISVEQIPSGWIIM